MKNKVKKHRKTKFSKVENLSHSVKSHVVSTADMWHNKKGLIKSNIYHLGVPSASRWFLSLERNHVDNEISKIILDACQAIEKYEPGSSSLLFYCLANEIKRKSHFRLGTKEIIKNIKKHVCGEAGAIVENVFNNISPTTHISVIDGNTSENVIELKNGYRSDLVIDKNFSKIIGTNNIVLNDVNILLVEGAVANVSEINSFLTKANETQQNWLLVCRSFPEELIATLGTNWLKRKLNVVPLQYGTSYKNINALVDLIKITGGLSINCQFGDVISIACNEKERYGFVNKVQIYDKNIVLNTDKDISAHKKSLINKMLNAEETLQQVYAERVSNLANELCEIRLRNSDTLIKEEVDWAVKYYVSGACSGFVKCENIIIPKKWYDVCTQVTKNLNKTLSTVGGVINFI